MTTHYETQIVVMHYTILVHVVIVSLTYILTSSAKSLTFIQCPSKLWTSSFIYMRNVSGPIPHYLGLYRWYYLFNIYLLLIIYYFFIYYFFIYYFFIYYLFNIYLLFIIYLFIIYYNKKFRFPIQFRFIISGPKTYWNSHDHQITNYRQITLPPEMWFSTV